VVAGVFGWLLGCCYVVTTVLRDIEIATVAVQLLSVLNDFRQTAMWFLRWLDGC